MKNKTNNLRKYFCQPPKLGLFRKFNREILIVQKRYIIAFQ